jgi:uncharacterized protein YxjI
MIQYPLELTFKFWSLTPQLSIQDASGTLLMYVRQKMFRFKEVINVFGDSQRQQLLYTIKADRIIDFAARYTFADDSGKVIGSVKQRGWKSLWHAHYDVFDGETIVFTIAEENPWIKVLDSLFAEIPVVGMFTGYVFNPVYLVNRAQGGVVMRLEKRPAFLSRLFTIKATDTLSDREQTQILLSLQMMLLLERDRG